MMRKQLKLVHWISSKGIWKNWDKHQKWVFLLAADANWPWGGSNLLVKPRPVRSLVRWVDQRAC